MTTWFGSDFHFGHKNIIKFCNRPFDNINEMNSFIIERFKNQVKNGDEVYFLGDFQFCKSTEWLQAITSIPGVNVHLIQGNHDDKLVRNFKGWSSSSQIKVIKVGDTKVAMCHYPIEEWPSKEHGAIHLHGHMHGMMSHKGSYKLKRLDVGYDNIGDVLISFDDVVTKITQDYFDYTKNIYE